MTLVADQAQTQAELNRIIEKQLDEAWRAQQRAFARVHAAVEDAKAAGWSNASIGYVLGMTEGGVRAMVKRQTKRMYQH
jgi:hypothetical protein